MIEIDENGTAREYEWKDGGWVLKADSAWNEDLADVPASEGEDMTG